MSTTRPLYAFEIREQMDELLRSRRSPEELAREFEPSARPIRNWVSELERRQMRPTREELDKEYETASGLHPKT